MDSDRVVEAAGVRLANHKFMYSAMKDFGDKYHGQVAIGISKNGQMKVSVQNGCDLAVAFKALYMAQELVRDEMDRRDNERETR